MITKLIEVQKLLKAPKNQYNSFGDYHYRSCEDILEAVKPLLAERGLLMTITDSVELIGDRYYIKATVKVTDGTHTYEVSAYARETLERPKMDAPQLTGAASTYARKYALNGMYCIDDAKDADALPLADANPAEKSKAFKASDEYKKLKEVASKKGVSDDRLKAFITQTIKVDNPGKMNPAQFRACFDFVEGFGNETK